MQFVKNALAAQDERTLFNKLREAALAYQITRKWSKERILRNYLNTIYFGNGAYGIESAARTYFGSNHPGCGEDGNPKCAQVLEPAEAAMIAGIVASPSGYDPLANREAAAKRRALVLQRMREQGYITAAQEAEANETSLPTRTRHPAPGRGHRLPVLHVLGQAAGRRQARRRPGGRAQGVRGRADRPDDARRPAPGGGRAGRRRPGCPTRAGRAPRSSRSTTAPPRCSRWWAATTTPRARSTWPRRASASPARRSRRSRSPRRSATGSPPTRRGARARSSCASPAAKSGRCKEAYEVNNYEDAYGGVRTLRTATTYSDNSVYAQLGQQGRHAQDRQARAPHGDPHARSPTTSRCRSAASSRA